MQEHALEGAQVDISAAKNASVGSGRPQGSVPTMARRGADSFVHHRNAPVWSPWNARQWPVGIVLSGLAFVVCILLTVTPLIRIPDTAIKLHIAAGLLLGWASAWLPVNLGAAYQPSSASIELFALLVLAFLCYGLSTLLVRRQGEKSSQFAVRCCIWLCTVLAGSIYIVTPAMLSHDIIVYAGYSRLLATYHANPYFVPMLTFPHDPITPVDQWASSVSAYGPVWMLVCGFWGWLVSPAPTNFVIVFRLFALAMHLLNIWLVGCTLQTMGRSPRTCTVGMLLYAWNPLVLLESSLGGHNDVFMLTFILVGVLLAVRAESNGYLLRARGYLPPAVALTLAVLVKFPAAPILAAYLLFLACLVLRSVVDNPVDVRQGASQGHHLQDDHKGRPYNGMAASRSSIVGAHPCGRPMSLVGIFQEDWRAALPMLCWSALAIILILLAFYGPFWFGHTPQEIIASFKSPPSSTFAENSFMRSVINWLNFHPEQMHNRLLIFLSKRPLWDDLTIVAIALCLILGVRQLWLKPSIGTFVTLALATMCVVMLITPWFFAWYITWIVGLAVLCLPVRQDRFKASLLAFAFTFSLSALTLYLFNSGLLGSRGYLTTLFDVVPPVCAFLVCWYAFKRPQRARPL
jgi:hypothetical protein